MFVGLCVCGLVRALCEGVGCVCGHACVHVIVRACACLCVVVVLVCIGVYLPRSECDHVAVFDHRVEPLPKLLKILRLPMSVSVGVGVGVGVCARSPDACLKGPRAPRSPAYTFTGPPNEGHTRVRVCA